MSHFPNKEAKYDLDAWLLHFEQLHTQSIDMGLTRISRVWQNIRHHLSIDKIAKTIITVAGTNGKGSVCKMLSLLTHPQYRIAVYTSPHINRPNERICINQQEVEDSMLIDAFDTIEQLRGNITLSYFEAFTLAALIIIHQSDIDVAILEVGLGGRLDATNIIDADGCIVTSISLDHENFLGNDLKQIAKEKLGIARPNKPCVYGDLNIDKQILNSCLNQGINMICNGIDYHANQIDDIPNHIHLLGDHQTRNAAATIMLLKQLKILPKNPNKQLSRFYLFGRMQHMTTNPDIWVDVAHNMGAAKSLAHSIQKIKKKHSITVGILGMLCDKNHALVLSETVPVFDYLILTSTDGDRGLTAEQLKAHSPKTNKNLIIEDNFKKALSHAQKVAEEEGMIVIYGSFQMAEKANQILIN